ncbi:sigma-54-dependent Fis family transcriptional regulator [Sphingomonas koreensis]|nr:sigma-54-dependent Fis family transcriptional regulator [Sphingomonas koreensis]
MSTESPRILFVDDDADIQMAARLLAERNGMALTGAPDPEAAWARLAETRFDVFLLDLNFSRGRTSGEEGFAMLARLLAADRDAVVIVVTGHSGVNIAVQAMREGASDFVIKPWSNDKLVAALDRGVALRRAKMVAGQASGAGDDDRLILGEDAAIVRLRDLVARVAPTEAAVLITGPAGSGKSLVARAIHQASMRGSRPLVTLSCGAVTDAEAMHATLDDARGATLVIDDFEGLPRVLQPVLADALGEVRTISTSRLDRGALRDAIHADLLFRLNTVELAIPPLARREGDALSLARYFLDRFAARHGRSLLPLTDAAAARIATHGWPDDVRGLRQAMERAVLLGDGAAHDLDAFAFGDGGPASLAIGDFNLARTEQALVEAALKRHAFNVSRAAADLGLTRTALYRRMAKYGL